MSPKYTEKCTELKAVMSETIVGAARFELATSCSQSRRATGLRHAPLCKYRNSLTPLGGFEKRPGVQETV